MTYRGEVHARKLGGWKWAVIQIDDAGIETELVGGATGEDDPDGYCWAVETAYEHLASYDPDAQVLEPAGESQ
jgi:hypothetical protein